MLDQVRPNRRLYDCGARHAKRFVEIGYLFSINDNLTYQGRAQILSKNFNYINHLSYESSELMYLSTVHKRRQLFFLDFLTTPSPPTHTHVGTIRREI